MALVRRAARTRSMRVGVPYFLDLAALPISYFVVAIFSDGKSEGLNMRNRLTEHLPSANGFGDLVLHDGQVVDKIDPYQEIK